MRLRGLRIAVWSLFAYAAACAQIVSAHEFKLDAVVNAFVKIEPGKAQLVIRAPLFLFKQVKFPVTGAEIDVDKSAPAIERALSAIRQDITLFEDGQPLVASHATGRLSLPSDRSFASYEQATSHVSEPLERGTSIYIDQGYVDARITYSISSPSAVFAIRTTAGPEFGDALKLALRYMPLDEDSRAMVITSLSGTVALNPTWTHAAAGFIGLGIGHILTGFDHLLFLLCLVIPLRGWRQILSVITVFTFAHSFTLLGSAFDLAPSGRWFPPFVEMAIAASIVYMALENIMGVNLERRVADHRPVRTGTRVRLLVWPPGELPVRWDPPARFALRVQHRHRTRPDPDPRSHAAGARGGTAVRAAWPGRHDHPLGDRRRHGLALDDRARGRAVEHAVAATGCVRPRDSGVLGHRHPSGGRRRFSYCQTAWARKRSRVATAGPGVDR